ncbi:hypothetical protein CARUB_v10016202mg [Capsella rubella]|uniref:RNase H type-1 domain-containing protein n=1 Tax=Capsella rubella TaxID=81985 RepID=R0GBB5_9BRAS|nr:uncharacterized protein LOC17891062 [Capsella rubella]EOA32886.1 hypothetical protein CARUB_v10016202mg [Capsella rubella]
MSQGFLVSIVRIRKKLFLDHMFDLLGKILIPEQRRKAIPRLLWGIWKSRNSTIFSARNNDHNILIASALEDSEVWFHQQSVMIQDTQGVECKSNRLDTRWFKPVLGRLKCNLNASWVKDSFFCGGAWIIRNHEGNALFHTRDAFVPHINRISAELSCILWCLRSLKDLHILSCEVWRDCNAVLAALESPLEWPKYRAQLDKIIQVKCGMGEISFHMSSTKANSLVREIASSVTRDGRLTSYLALGGPAWLQERLTLDSH